MKLITFALSAVNSDSPIARFVTRTTEAVSPTTAHVIGLGSGATGLALWAEVAKHLTVMAGLLVALMAFLGGGFYATYWALKAFQQWQEVRATAGKRRR